VPSFFARKAVPERPSGRAASASSKQAAYMLARGARALPLRVKAACEERTMVAEEHQHFLLCLPTTH
jgi:cystathionine beta-lyase/cystathionine gamma-synthase